MNDLCFTFTGSSSHPQLAGEVLAGLLDVAAERLAIEVLACKQRGVSIQDSLPLVIPIAYVASGSGLLMLFDADHPLEGEPSSSDFNPEACDES